MNNNFSRLRHQQKQESTSEEQQQAAETREFASVEEMLREDVAHTEVPASVAVKLNQSIAKLPPLPSKSWWQRFFSRD